MKLTFKSYHNFLNLWEESLIQHQRLGQAFCNQMNVKDDALFYEMSDAKAKTYIQEHYVNLES